MRERRTLLRTLIADLRILPVQSGGRGHVADRVAITWRA